MVAVGAVGGSVKTARTVNTAIRMKDIDLVEDVVTVVARIAVKACVDAVDEQTTVGERLVEHTCIVAVLDDVKLVGVVAGDFIDVTAVAFPCGGFKLVGAIFGDFGDVSNPVAVFVFHIHAHVLRRAGIAAHQVPGANGIEAGVVMIKVGSAQGMVHLVAERADVEISSDFELKVEIIDAQSVQPNLSIKDAPAMWPKQ